MSKGSDSYSASDNRVKRALRTSLRLFIQFSPESVNEPRYDLLKCRLRVPH
jgi:hypothetical protein